MTLPEQVNDILATIREPLAVDRWQVRVGNQALPDCRACCVAQPEYREADLFFDFEKLQTGDDLAELTVHETTHLHTWPLHALCERLANALANSLPETHREGVREMLHEEVRLAGETVTTDVGHTYLRLLRRAGILDTPAVNG